MKQVRISNRLLNSSFENIFFSYEVEFTWLYVESVSVAELGRNFGSNLATSSPQKDLHFARVHFGSGKFAPTSNSPKEEFLRFKLSSPHEAKRRNETTDGVMGMILRNFTIHLYICRSEASNSKEKKAISDSDSLKKRLPLMNPKSYLKKLELLFCR